MTTHPIIRNIDNVTTGDFMSFEVLRGGEWKRMRISGTALNKLDGNRQRPREDSFAENMDAIAKAAEAMLDRVNGDDLLITSDDC